MAEPDPTVTFRVYDDARLLCTEETATDQHSFTRDPVMGQIVITTADSEVVIEDEIIPLILYTLEAIAELSQRDNVVISRSNDYGYIRLDREGDRLRISGDGLPDIRLNRAPLLRAIVDCAERFCRWATSAIPSKDPTALEQELAEALAKARAAL
jgi:hypothetical protein